MIGLFIFVLAIIAFCLVLCLIFDGLDLASTISDIFDKYKEKRHMCINCQNYDKTNNDCYVPFSMVFNKNKSISRYSNIVQKQNNTYVPVSLYFDYFDNTSKTLAKHEEDGDIKQIRINVKYINNIISVFGRERLLKEFDKLNLYQKGNLRDNECHNCDRFRKKKGKFF